MIKKTIHIVDNLIFKNMIKDYVRKKRLNSQLNDVESGLGFKFITCYAKNSNDELSKLCDKYGSDKGEIVKSGHPYPWQSHTYADFYSSLFSHCRDGVTKVFECGLGTNNPNLQSSMGSNGVPGASLRVWRDYFPNALVYGGDIDENILFEEDRIKTYCLDQLDPSSIKNFWNVVEVDDFDFIIDDGLHTFDAGITLFTHSIKKLSNKGIYVIEDVGVNDLLKYKNFFSNQSYVVEYVMMFRTGLNVAHNNLVVIRKK